MYCSNIYIFKDKPSIAPKQWTKKDRQADKRKRKEDTSKIIETYFLNYKKKFGKS